MNKLIILTILVLTLGCVNQNEFMEKRSEFYTMENNEKLKEKIMWYDLYYGLIQKDKELNGGKNISLIAAEFKKSNFPIRKIAVVNT